MRKYHKKVEREYLESAIAKAVAAFPHLSHLPERDIARNASRLVIPGLTGLELLALCKAAGGLEVTK